MAIVYKLTNTEDNNRCYVGATTLTLDERLWNHVSSSRNPGEGFNTPFHKALREYGREAFTEEVLFESDDVELVKGQMEAFYIKKYAAYTEGYNLTMGGYGRPGYKEDEEARRKKRLWWKQNPQKKTKPGFRWYTNGTKTVQRRPGQKVPKGYYVGRHNARGQYDAA